LGNAFPRLQPPLAFSVTPSNEILSQADMGELRAILDYANKFHHDTNPAYETEQINDTELKCFARRTLAFTKRT
jgi:hypothetical protein